MSLSAKGNMPTKREILNILENEVSSLVAHEDWSSSNPFGLSQTIMNNNFMFFQFPFPDEPRASYFNLFELSF